MPAGDEGLILEGATRIAAPAVNLQHAPGKTGKRPSARPGARSKGEPFYNPGMALNRDLSVLLVEALAKERGREIDVADALAGTGARSLRIAKEVKGNLIVHANDAMPQATAAARKAATANALGARLTVTEGDAHAFLASQRFDLVDLDPCGSPMPFLDAAMRATRHGGLLCATATDTGALSGTYARACQRRYDAHHGLHAPAWRGEVGLRILAGAIVRSAARFDKVAVPVLSVTRGHWMRVVARVEDGKRDADAALKLMGEAVVDADGFGRFAPHDRKDGWAGPLWTGSLHDGALVASLQTAMAGKSLACPEEVTELLELMAQESDAPAFWIVPDLLTKRLGPPPRRDILIERLRKAGFTATRTHLDPQGVRTNADLPALKAAWG